MTPDFRIDAHHHLWDLANREQTWTEGLPELHRTFTMDDLIPHLIDNDIAGTATSGPRESVRPRCCWMD